MSRLLENVRFYPGEETNDPVFAEALAKLGDLYVNDAFGAAHRAHASTAGITKFVKQSAMGFLMEKEIQYLSDELAEPAKPFVVILGRLESFGQNRRDQSADGKSRHHFDLRRDGEHVFRRRRAFRLGAAGSKPDKLDLAREICSSWRKKKECAFSCRSIRWKRRKIEAGATARNTSRVSPTTRNHRRLAGGRYRPRHDHSFRRRNREGENHSLERTGRDFRDSGFRRRHDCDRRSAGAFQGHDDHRRRRFRHRGKTSRTRPTR